MLESEPGKGATFTNPLTGLKVAPYHGCQILRPRKVEHENVEEPRYFENLMTANSLRQFCLVVVQHLFMTGTAQFAHVVLPSSAFSEEEVSFTSSDRRIQLARQAIEPPPGPIPAWEQIALVGCAMGADWKYSSAADVMDEIGEAVPFYSGASHDNLAREYGRQWPCTKDRPLSTRFFFADGSGARRFKFVPVPKPALEASPKDYPFTLVFGHSLYYWNQNVLIQHSETLKREYRILLLDYPNGFVEINTADAKALGIRDGEKIRLRSASGSAAYLPVCAVVAILTSALTLASFIKFFGVSFLSRTSALVTVIGFIVERLRSIRDQYGPDALAFLNSPRCSNEETYLLQKLARVVVCTNNVDHGTGVYCNISIGELMSSEVIIVDGVDLGRQLFSAWKRAVINGPRT
jgi:predicted molibdopterin-dependent oxidoreductase YjgC